MKKMLDPRGSVIFLTLVTVLIMFFYSAALISRNVMALSYSRHSINSLRAQQMAQAGLNHLLERLAYNGNFGLSSADNIYHETADKDESYHVTFDVTSPYYSINNLRSITDHPTANFEGDIVNPTSADVVITGIAGKNSGSPTTRRIHAVLRRTFDYDLSIGAEGSVRISAETTIDGIESMMTKDVKVGGGIHSNKAVDPISRHEDYSCWMDWPGYVTMGDGTTLTSAGEMCDCWYVFPQHKEYVAPKPLPYFSIVDIVNKKSSKPLPDSVIQSGINNYSAKHLNITEERHVPGNLVVDGILNMCDATLYVDGNLTVKGGINGYGGIFVSGNFTVQGGSVSLMTNQKNAAAVFAGGNIKIDGAKTEDYLELLSNQYPEVKYKYDIFKDQYNALITFANSKEHSGSWDFSTFEATFGKPKTKYRKLFIDGVDGEVLPPPQGADQDRVAAVCFWWASYKLACLDEESPSLPQNFTFAISEVDGHFSTASDQATIPALIKQIEDSCGALIETEIGVKRALLGLHELAYFYRHPFSKTVSDYVFHDSDLPMESQSIDHLLWHTVNPTGVYGESNIMSIAGGNPGLPGELYALEPNLYNNIAREFIVHNNPLAKEWSEVCNFQGLLYANGDISITSDLEIYGAVISRGTVELGKSNITYVAEFMTLFGYTTPLQLVKYRDF